MTSAPNQSSRPRTLTDAVRARQARRGGESPRVAKAAGGETHGGASTRRGASTRPGTSTGHGASTRRGASTGHGASAGKDAERQSRGGGAESWLSRLLTPLKWLRRKFLEVFNALVSEHGDRLRELGAGLAATMLAKRLPGPLRWLAELFISGMKGERGFGFWWVVVTLGVALAVGALVALLVLPVAALIALIAVGIWMLVRRARTKDDDQDRANGSRRGGNGGREPALAGAPS